MNLRRASFLTAITLCVLAFFVSSSTASAVARVIGRLQVDPPALNVRVNGQPARPGSEIRQGDLVETGRNSAVINLISGQCVEVFATLNFLAAALNFLAAALKSPAMVMASNRSRISTASTEISPERASAAAVPVRKGPPPLDSIPSLEGLKF